jgi:hypothetical protein
MTTCEDFKVDHLRPHEQVIARAVLKGLPKGAVGGGCRAFYSPDEWAKRGEEYGTKSLLVVVHDGGDLASACNMDYCEYGMHDHMVKTLEKHGLYIEQCTCWYSAVYRA